MPKRVIDFDALWASDKLAACAEWAQSEYAWLYGLADASGSFEMTNLRVIWGRVAAIRKNLTLERLEQIFDEFIARGLLFTWEENGKRYGHWTGSDVPGRLPAPSWRARLEKLAPPVPRHALAVYSARFGGSKEGIVITPARVRPRRTAHGGDPGFGSTIAASWAAASVDGRGRGINPAVEEPQAELKHGLEQAQGQDGDLYSGLKEDLEKEKEVCPPPHRAENWPAVETPCSSPQELPFEPRAGAPRELEQAACTPEELLEIYEDERGELPPAGAMTPERHARCARLLAGGLTPREFRAAVRLAAATPFLAGDGDRGWQANFDWLVANRGNVRKVLAGEYAPRLRARATKPRAERAGLADLYAGMGPSAAECGVRANPAALERIRAREARIAAACAGSRGADAASVGGAAPKAIAFDAPARASPAAVK